MAKVFDQVRDDFSERIALVDEAGVRLTYSEMFALGDELLHEVGPGRAVIAMEAINSVSSIAAYAAAMRSEHVVLMLPPGDGQHRGGIATTFQPDWTVWPAEGGCVVRREAGAGLHPEPHPDLKLLLSTSGSTGSPKLVRLSAANVQANARSIIEYLDLQPDEVAITTLPPYYSYGLSVLNSHFLVGATLALTEGSVASAGFWPYFDEVKATSFAGVPHTFDLLEASGFLESSHPSLRYFTQAGGRLPPDKVRLFAGYAKDHGARFFVMYGQTEASPRIAYVPPEDVASYPDHIGRAIPGGALRLAGINPETGVGELVYSGPNVMMGYAESRDQLSLGKQVEELATGDLAIQNETNGYFKIVGRAARFIKPFGVRVGLDEVERMVAALGVKAVATGNDQRLVLGVVGDCPSELAGEVARALKVPVSVVGVVHLDEVPRLGNGKVDYQSILRRAPAPEATGGSGLPLHQAVGALLGVPGATAQDSFASLGGDSLSYVQVTLLLEQRLGGIPEGWTSMSFAELDDYCPAARGSSSPMDTDILLRAVAIVGVVVHHVTDWKIGGFAAALAVLAGFNFVRFLLPGLVGGRGAKVVGGVVWQIVPLYYATITAFFLYYGSFGVQNYFFASGFGMPFLGPDGEPKLTTFWFIEFYVLIVLMISAVLQSPVVRRSATNRPWVLPICLMGFFLACRVVFLAWPHELKPYGNSLFSVGYIFMVGWIAFLARGAEWRVKIRAALVGLAILAPWDIGNASTSVLVYNGAFLLMVFVDRVPIHNVLRKLLLTISASSFHIYVIHGFPLFAFRHFYGRDLPPKVYVAATVICIATGIASRYASSQMVLRWRARGHTT